MLRLAAAVVAVTLTAASRAGADDTRAEVWPEVDAWIQLRERARLFLLATLASGREDAYSEGMLGVHLDVRLQRRSLFRTRRISKSMAEERAARFSVRLGYRYAASLGDEADSFEEHRALGELTGRWGLPGQVRLSDRNRADFRWLDGQYSFRYRNRVTLERDVGLQGYELTPYGSAEIYYDTRFDAFNRSRFSLGVQAPINRHVMLDTYLARQKDTRSAPSRVDALGLALNVSF